LTDADPLCGSLLPRRHIRAARLNRHEKIERILSMGTKKQRKARRRVEKNMEQAWQAFDAGDCALAEKLSRRAVDDGKINPRIWNEHGLMLQLCNQAEEAADAFRYAIAMAPNYSDALANLARLLLKLGQVAQAVRLQRRRVELDPSNTEAVELLHTFEALLPAPAPVEAKPPFAVTERTGRYDWSRIEAALTNEGCAHLPGLLDANECGELRSLFVHDHRFEHTVVCNDQRGILTYRFFTPPLPELVAALRREFYFRLAPVANRWMEMLGGSAALFPPELEAFAAVCADAGQRRSSPILLHYRRGGFNALHRDVVGSVFFPLQLAVTLGPANSPDGSGGSGGEFMLADDGPGKKAIATIATGAGDAMIFCTRHRLAKVGGRYGLQAVHHGLTPVLADERYALGVPFHAYAGE
jgi:hypothetical protein